MTPITVNRGQLAEVARTLHLSRLECLMSYVPGSTRQSRAYGAAVDTYYGMRSVVSSFGLGLTEMEVWGQVSQAAESAGNYWRGSDGAPIDEAWLANATEILVTIWEERR